MRRASSISSWRSLEQLAWRSMHSPTDRPPEARRPRRSRRADGDRALAAVCCRTRPAGGTDTQMKVKHAAQERRHPVEDARTPHLARAASRCALRRRRTHVRPAQRVLDLFRNAQPGALHISRTSRAETLESPPRRRGALAPSPSRPVRLERHLEHHGRAHAGTSRSTRRSRRARAHAR